MASETMEDMNSQHEMFSLPLVISSLPYIASPVRTSRVLNAY
jgi:hypothetical protein